MLVEGRMSRDRVQPQMCTIYMELETHDGLCHHKGQSHVPGRRVITP